MSFDIVPGQAHLFFGSPQAVILRSEATPALSEAEGKNLSFPQRDRDSSLPTVATKKLLSSFPSERRVQRRGNTQNDKRAREQDKSDWPSIVLQCLTAQALQYIFRAA